MVYAGHAVLRDKGQQLMLCPRVRRNLLLGGIEDHTIPTEQIRLQTAFPGVDRVNAAMARVVDAENLSHRQHAWMQLNFEPPVLRTGRVESGGGRDPEVIEVAPRPSLAERVAARREAQRKAFEADWREYVAERPRLGAVALREHWIELCQSHGVEPGSAPGDLEWTAEGVRRVGVVAPKPVSTPASVTSPGAAGKIGDVFQTDIGMELLWIPAEKFLMGSPEGVGDRDERPQTEVTITRPFWMGRFEVRQRDWAAVMGNNPSEFKGEDLPVESVDWNQSAEFGKKLTERMKGKLPTEAEWEYACRAETTTKWSFGDNESALE